jgi:hypothetical protein
LPNTEYELCLMMGGHGGPGTGGQAASGSTAGIIRAQALRVDIVQTGGRFIEPIYGRPRHVQGAIIDTDPAANTITVACAPECAIVCELASAQNAAEFPIGSLVACDVKPGATFEPV